MHENHSLDVVEMDKAYGARDKEEEKLQRPPGLEDAAMDSKTPFMKQLELANKGIIVEDNPEFLDQAMRAKSRVESKKSRASVMGEPEY